MALSLLRSSRSLRLPGALRSLDIEEIGGLHAQDPRKTVDHIDSGAVLAAFQRADIGAMDAGPVSEVLLGNAPCTPQGANV